MTTVRTVAVIDIGKTNAKVVLVDAVDLREIAVRTMPNRVVDQAPYPHFDTDGLWDFILESLKALNAQHPVDAISITTHGATGVVLDGNGALALPVIDYEFAGPGALAARYEQVRPPFSESGTPKLPGGLNVGAQLYYQAQTFPEAFSRARTILMYAQYWSYRLSGILSNELTSLGCHTDLWEPDQNRYSSLVKSQGWEPLMAPVRKASDVLGPVKADVAAFTGIAATVPVCCGIHDSNASLLPHVLSVDPPFSVVSTGTWVILMSVGGRDVQLDEKRDTLINVNALGQPVRSARFMGGRTFEMLNGDRGVEAAPEDIESVLAGGIMLLPSIPQGSGPYPKNKAYWTVSEDQLTPGVRTVAVSFHLALMTTTSLDLIGADGRIIVEGPFAANSEFKRMLAAATGRPVLSGGSATGTSIGAALLAAGRRPSAALEVFDYASDGRLQEYARTWRALAEADYSP